MSWDFKGCKIHFDLFMISSLHIKVSTTTQFVHILTNKKISPDHKHGNIRSYEMFLVINICSVHLFLGTKSSLQ